jgi:hypothetical protein
MPPISLGMGCALTQLGSNIFNPTSISGLQAWYSTRYPSSMISDGAASFASASSQSLSVSNNSSFMPAENLMVGCWVNSTTLPGTGSNHRLISHWLTTGDKRSYDLSIINTSGTIKISALGSSLGTSSFTSVTTSHTPSTGVWTFAVMWWTSGQLYLEIDNTTRSNAALSSMYAGSAALYLGARETGADYFNGAIDSAFLIKAPSSLGNGTAGSLARTIISYLYNSGAGRRYSDLDSTQKTDWGLVSWWDLNEATGTRYDRHGTNNLTASASSPTLAAGIASGTATYTGDPITQWQDLSGNGRHFTQSTSSKRPTLATSGINSQPCITFDGVDDTLSYLSAFGLSSVAGYSVFCVLQFQGTANQVALSSQNSVTQLQRDSTKTYTYSASAVYGSTSTVTISPRIYTTVFDGSGSGNSGRLKLYISGTEETLAFNGTVGTTTGTSAAIYLGSSNDTVAFSSAKISEVLIYSSTLSTAQRQHIERNLGRIYGITVS